MRGNIRGVQGPSIVTMLAAANQQRRYGSQIEIKFPGERCRQPLKPAWSRRSPSFMSVLQKVGKQEVHSSGSAQARPQSMEEPVAVKHLNLIHCNLMKGSPAQCSRQAWATVAPRTSNLRRFKYCNDLPENHHATAVSPLPTLYNTNPLDSS